jgi:DnaJ-domain-containing protein 1
MPFDSRKLAKFQAGMRKRIGELKTRTEECLDIAMDGMMQDRLDSYFKVEEGLAEIERSLGLIEEELNHVPDLATATRLGSRLEFMEDRFEEFESEVRQRPRRRRRRINLMDFLKAAGGQWGDGSRTLINNPSEAFAALGLQAGSSMADVTHAFRRRAKQLHPDARRGDRSSEPELRQIIEAYQYLKEHLGVGDTSPSVNPGATYSPFE